MLTPLETKETRCIAKKETPTTWEKRRLISLYILDMKGKLIRPFPEDGEANEFEQAFGVAKNYYNDVNILSS